MKFLPLSLRTSAAGASSGRFLSVAAVFLGLGWHIERAIAQIEADYVCFVTDNSGQVIDLSTSVCKLDVTAKPAAPKVTINSDQAFIDAYKNSLTRYPDVRDRLLTNVTKSPQSIINQAKSVCDDLEAGVTLDDIKQDRADAVAGNAATFNVSLVTSLATQYYCPQFNEQSSP